MEGHDVKHIKVSDLRQSTNPNPTESSMISDTEITTRRYANNTENPELTLRQVEDIKHAVMHRYSIAELSKAYNVSMLTICECLLQ